MLVGRLKRPHAKNASSCERDPRVPDAEGCPYRRIGGTPCSPISGLRESESIGHARTDDGHVVFSVEPFHALVVALRCELLDLTYVAIEADTRRQ